jgi:hypothetical protein
MVRTAAKQTRMITANMTAYSSAAVPSSDTKHRRSLEKENSVWNFVDRLVRSKANHLIKPPMLDGWLKLPL